MQQIKGNIGNTMMNSITISQGENTGWITNESLNQFARNVNVTDPTMFSECLDSQKYNDIVTENNQLAQAIGLKSAPTFILVRDGKEPLGIVGAQPYNVFQGAITQLESNEIKPSPDLKWTKYNNSTLGLSYEYPSSWNLNSTDNSLSDPVNGNIFQIALSNETIPIDIKSLSDDDS